MLFPIGDDDRRLQGTAYVTLAFVALNLFVFFVLQQAGANVDFTYGWSVIPAEITSGADITTPQVVEAGDQRVEVPAAPGPTPIYLTVLTAMFMHGGYAHLFGNLLYLWIFGDNVEVHIGAATFLVFYLLCGVTATLAQVALEPGGVVPNLGASGAISGVLGAYIVFFPRNRVHALFFYFIVSIPAFVAIGLWIVFQFFSGVGAVVAAEPAVGGVAYGAHIGGFITGVIFAGGWRLIRGGPAQEELDRRSHQRKWR